MVKGPQISRAEHSEPHYIVKVRTGDFCWLPGSLPERGRVAVLTRTVGHGPGYGAKTKHLIDRLFPYTSPLILTILASTNAEISSKQEIAQGLPPIRRKALLEQDLVSRLQRNEPGSIL